MKTFSQWLETTNHFKKSEYTINGKNYNVPKLAEWAKKNLEPEQLSIADIQKRYIWADKLFTSADDLRKDQSDDGLKTDPEWITRSMSTELSFPILMLQHPDGKWEIIDGNHRTWKAWNSGMKSIEGYLIIPANLPDPNQI
jgi:hypothetical protein